MNPSISTKYRNLMTNVLHEGRNFFLKSIEVSLWYMINNQFLRVHIHLRNMKPTLTCNVEPSEAFIFKRNIKYL